MRKVWLTLTVVLLGACLAVAANIKLYLKDGSYQLVREYQTQTDRVRYFSTERGEWEEIPLDLVDLKRTESEATEHQATLEKEAKADAVEEAAAKAVRDEVSRIPQDPGVYWVEGKDTRVMKAAEVTVRTDKGRSFLQKITPIPALVGKATMEIPGAHSANFIPNPEQEFYVQLEDVEAYGIVKLTTKGSIRIVENIQIHPIDKSMVQEDRTPVDILQRQMADRLYKIWPKDKLEPGEYAVLVYNDGKLDAQVFDFAIKK